MEFKGTKGKWVLRTFPYGQMSVRTLDDSRKICVSRVQNNEESEYNLKIISKAPEMLEMLEKVLDVIAPEFPDDDQYNLIVSIKQLIKEATTI